MVNPIQQYSQLGIMLFLNSKGNIGFKAPYGVLLDNMKQEIKNNKQQIIEYLKAQQSTSTIRSEDILNEGIYKKQIYEQLPELWKFALHQTIARNKPSTVSSDKWHTIITQINLWLNNNLMQLKEIIAKGWTLQEIFSCHKISPQRRYDNFGLLMLLNNNDTIEQITVNNITIKTASGVIQNFYKMSKIYSDKDNYFKMLNPNSIYAIELFKEEDCIATEERAAIMEYDGMLTKEKAEMQALQQIKASIS